MPRASSSVRRQSRVAALVLLLGAAVVMASCGSGDSETGSTTLPPLPAATLHTAAPAAAAWCKKLDDLPKAISFRDLKPSDLAKLGDLFTDLRQVAPPEVQPDFDVLIDFIRKFDQSLKAHTVGTSQDDAAKWAVQTYGPDGVNKFKKAFENVLVAQANNC